MTPTDEKLRELARSCAEQVASHDRDCKRWGDCHRLCRVAAAYQVILETSVKVRDETNAEWELAVREEREEERGASAFGLESAPWVVCDEILRAMGVEP